MYYFIYSPASTNLEISIWCLSLHEGIYVCKTSYFILTNRKVSLDLWKTYSRPYVDLVASGGTDNRWHDDVIKGKHFPRYWPFVWGIHRWPVNSPHKDQWRAPLTFSLIWINGWVNNCEAGDLRRHQAHYDIIVMVPLVTTKLASWRRFALFHLELCPMILRVQYITRDTYIASGKTRKCVDI